VFLNHSNIEVVPNKRQPGDSPRTTKQTNHVEERTHGLSHILDLVIFRIDDYLIMDASVYSMLSDHFHISVDVSLEKQSVSANVISYRKYK